MGLPYGFPAWRKILPRNLFFGKSHLWSFILTAADFLLLAIHGHQHRSLSIATTITLGLVIE
ncbi:MAG: hypothetical protein CMO55_12055 [Verrucomicrobiales bacterium]|nr:hypothetical protein [Verrucomicrobiales bacterium]